MTAIRPQPGGAPGLETAGTKFLLYHDLASLRGGNADEARELFRHQLRVIAETGHRFRTMAEFLSGDARDHRDVVITFDDGGRSFIDCALPVLKEFSARATIFIIAGFVGRVGRTMPFLDWDEIGALAAEGIDIGSHGLGHPVFTDLDAESVRRDLELAAEAFATHGLSPTTFAYPYGRKNDAVKKLVREAGFQAAFTIKQGGHDAFELRRRLFTLVEPAPLVRFFVADTYFPVRNAIVSLVPGRLRRECRPIPPELWGANAFGVEGWESPPGTEGVPPAQEPPG